MDNEFGLKELYDLTLKATYSIEINGRVFEPGEVIARFDKIQMADFKELTEKAQSNGGKNNAPIVTWESSKEMRVSFSQGVFSKTQFAILSNAKMIQHDQGGKVIVPMHEAIESDEQGKIVTTHQNIQNVFVYDAKTFEKLKPISIDLEKGEVVIDQAYLDVEIDYQYEYTNNFSLMSIGHKLIEGFLLLEGKTRVKDDITGKTRTAILRIPRLKLVSDLSMRLGREAGPLLANFSAVGYPGVSSRDKTVMEMLFLSDDIDAEM